MGLSDSSRSPGETHLCGTAVTSRTFAAPQPKFLMTSLHYFSLRGDRLLSCYKFLGGCLQMAGLPDEASAPYSEACTRRVPGGRLGWMKCSRNTQLSITEAASRDAGPSRRTSRDSERPPLGPGSGLPAEGCGRRRLFISYFMESQGADTCAFTLAAGPTQLPQTKQGGWEETVHRQNHL